MVQGKYPTINVMPVYDNKSDEVWSSNLDKVIADLAYENRHEIVLHHSRDSFVTHYHGSCPTKEWDAVAEDNGTRRRQEIWDQGPVDHPLFRQGIIYNANARYPICNPAVDMFVFNHKNHKVLFGRRKGMTEWRILGGFVDPKDASYREAAVRELKEEAGLVISSTAFEMLDSFKIDDWGYPEYGKDRIFSTLFWVDYDGDQEAKGDDDIEETRWFSIDEIRGTWTDIPLKFASEHRPLIQCAIAHYHKLKLDEVQ